MFAKYIFVQLWYRQNPGSYRCGFPSGVFIALVNFLLKPVDNQRGNTGNDEEGNHIQIFLNRLFTEHALTILSLTSEIRTRSCFMLSRSRIVTVSSSSV